METQILEELGLSKNEIKAYLKLMEIGSSTAVQISKLTKLHRSNTYDLLNRLVSRGLVAHFQKETTTYYEVDNPEQLMTLLDSKERSLKDLIPELKTLQLSAMPPSKVAVFEGSLSVRRLMTEMVEQSKEISVLGAPKNLAALIGEGWVNDWHAMRIKEKVTFNHLVNEDYLPHRIKILRDMGYTNIKFLPKQYNNPHAIFIYSRGINMIFTNPLLAIRITGNEINKSFTKYFKMLSAIAEDKAPSEKNSKR